MAADGNWQIEYVATDGVDRCNLILILLVVVALTERDTVTNISWPIVEDVVITVDETVAPVKDIGVVVTTPTRRLI